MKKWAIALLFAALVAVVVAGAVGGRWYGDNRKPNFTGNHEMFIYPGMSVSKVVESIPDSVVSRRRSLERVMSELSDEDLKPGHYVIEKGKPSIYVPRMLKAGWQTPVNLTLSGTMRQKSVIARKISRQMMMDSTTVMRALEDKALLSSYGFTPDDVFSLFIPDTYQVYWTDSMKEVLDKQKAAYDDFWTADNLKLASAQGLTPKEVSVVASIVKSESNHEPEYPSTYDSPFLIAARTQTSKRPRFN